MVSQVSLPNSVAKYRNRMRGFATLFIAIGVIGAASVAIASISGREAGYTIEAMIDRGLTAGFIIMTGFMAWNGSRFGAVMLFLLFLSGFSALFTGISPSMLGGLARTTAYTALSGLLIWNAHRYHQECNIEALPLGGSALVRWGGLALSLPVIGLIVAGLAILANPVSSKVIRGSEVTEEQYQWLSEKSYLLADEKLLFLYSDGLFSLSEGGTMLTDKYVGTWWTEDGELKEYWIRIGEVCNIETLDDGSELRDADYKIHGAGEDNWFRSNLSIDDDGHDQLIRRLSVLNERQMHPLVKAACESGDEIDYAKVAEANGISANLVAGDLVTEDQVKWLTEQDYITDDETILTLYSHGTYHIDEGGSLLTDKYFGGWYKNSGVAGFIWAEIGEICSFEAPEESTSEGHVLHKITFGDDGWYKFKLPKADNQAVDFMARLESMNAAAATLELQAACQTSQTEDTSGSDQE